MEVVVTAVAAEQTSNGLRRIIQLSVRTDSNFRQNKNIEKIKHKKGEPNGRNRLLILYVILPGGEKGLEKGFKKGLISNELNNRKKKHGCFDIFTL